MQKHYNFDAFDGRKFLFGYQLDVSIDTRIHDHQMVEVLLVVGQFDGHGIVQDLHAAKLIVEFSVLGVQIEAEHANILFYYSRPNYKEK